MVARGVADIVQIVVLAARAHAFLRRSGAHIIALLNPGEAILELHHAGIGKHQGGVIARNERRTFDLTVPVADEKIKECGPDVVQGWHDAGLSVGL